MKRFIIGRLGVFMLLAAFSAAGCAFEQASENGDNSEQTEEGVEVAIGTSDEEQVSAGDGKVVKHSTTSTSTRTRTQGGSCPGCGPLPDPWKMGPLPDPWSSSSSSSSSSSGGSTSSSSSSSSSTSSSGNAPKP